MKRPVYKICTEEDMKMAIRWIRQQYMKYRGTFPNSYYGLSMNKDIRFRFDKIEENPTPEGIQHWCDYSLDHRQWVSVKNCIHEQKYPERYYDDDEEPMVHLSLSNMAYSKLKDLAKTEDITFSQIIEKYLFIG